MEMKTFSINTYAHLTVYIPEGSSHQTSPRPGIILAPGGAYLLHADSESESVALAFTARGYNVYVLAYTIAFLKREELESGMTHITTPSRFPQSVYDMFESMHFIKTNAKAFNQDVEHLFMMGFSAGGHLCALAGIFYDDPAYTSHLSFIPEKDELKATGMVLCYPMLSGDPKELMLQPEQPARNLMSQFLYDTETPTPSQIAALDPYRHVKDTTCPTFIWHFADDDVVVAGNSTRFILALQQHNIDCEYHLFSRGIHGLGLCNDGHAGIRPDVAFWIDHACHWMASHA